MKAESINKELLDALKDAEEEISGIYESRHINADASEFVIRLRTVIAKAAEGKEAGL